MPSQRLKQRYRRARFTLRVYLNCCYQLRHSKRNVLSWGAVIAPITIELCWRSVWFVIGYDWRTNALSVVWCGCGLLAISIILPQTKNKIGPNCQRTNNLLNRLFVCFATWVKCALALNIFLLIIKSKRRFK